MKTLLTSLFALFVLVFPSAVSAWSSGGGIGPTFPINLDLASGVSVTAIPSTITAGEETRVQWGSFLLDPEEHAQCTTDFSYTPVVASIVDQGNGYWAVVNPGGYLNDYPTTTKTYTVTCPYWYTQNNGAQTFHETKTVSATVTVESAAAIDLTAASVLPPTVSGLDATLSSTISNVGVEATPTGFTNLFQRATDSSGTNATDIGTYVRSAVLAGSSDFVAILSYTFPSTATWYLRACADKSSGVSSGSITESDENNNCSPWTAVSVNTQCSDGLDNNGAGGTDYPADASCDSPSDTSEDGVVPAVSCRVNGGTVPISVTAGGNAVYTAMPATGAGAPYTWTPASQTCTGGTTSSQDCTFTNPGPYTMSVRATGAGNPTASCPLVTVGCAGSPEVEITASEERVKSETGTFTISWDVSGVDAASCSITGVDGSGNVSYDTDIVVSMCIAEGGPVSPGPIDTQTIYTIDCEGTTASVIVNVDVVHDEF